MKDYTISHPCGLEETYRSKVEAQNTAINHFKDCELKQEWVAIDEYDTAAGDMGGGELTGRYWKVSSDGKVKIG